MGKDSWKESAVMFYAAATVVTVIFFTTSLFCIITKNRARKRSVQKCCCCFNAVHEDFYTIGEEENDGLLSEGDSMFSIDDPEGEEEEEDQIQMSVL